MATIDVHTRIPMIPDSKPGMKVSILGKVENYNLSLTNVPEMWRRTKGKGVKVAILDSGVPNHRDINVSGGRTFIDGYFYDLQGHACGVGAIIAGRGSGGMGVQGVAPEADDYYGTVLDHTGTGSISTVAQGIRWAVDTVNADVINMSLGIPNSIGCLDEIRDACQYAYSKGVTLVAAAGNDGGEVNWPAALDTVIAVAAVDRKLRCADFSSRGPEVEFAAGGVDVMTAYKNNGYAMMSGTSFSAPVITGIAALIISEYKLAHHGVSPSVGEVREALKSIAYDLGPKGKDDFTGWGIPVFTRDVRSVKQAGSPRCRSFLKKVSKFLGFRKCRT